MYKCPHLHVTQCSPPTQCHSLPQTLHNLSPQAASTPPNPPVLPNPPAPLTLSSNLSTTTTSGITIRSTINCAMRSPTLTSKSSSDRLARMTPTGPR
ncbi:predicted protein [Plenodomus lingam JN3]|uniref:Predicted protein n=1 Tax=Leptosphaeria maculans (strain JN3 / isolate v23.1.3 / race Av1-4-5-6-7-8) TaxID=985895 RepID=E4ZXI3_LEPMJ|nr:predicted protein [Plenodomus lingam JN3]CBX95393.1 predicted protein [Plenodomus lingam JN3]